MGILGVNVGLLAIGLVVVAAMVGIFLYAFVSGEREHREARQAHRAILKSLEDKPDPT